MAYITIAAGDYAAGQPITTTLAQAWSTNAEEIASGGTSAPRVQPGALDSSILTINNASWGVVQSVAAGSTLVLPVGIYAVAWVDNISLTYYSGPQLRINGVWEPMHSAASGADTTGSSVVVSDGTNCRINADAVGGTVYYHKVL